MRRFFAPVALIAALVLAGCSTSTLDAAPSTEPSTETSSEPSASPAPAASDLIDMAALEQGLVDTVRAQVGDEAAGYTDEDLVALGQSICKSLTANVEPSTIQSDLTSGGISENVAVNLITGAGVLLCSDQGAKVIGGW